MQGGDIEFPQRCTLIFSHSLQDSFVLQTQDQVARVPLESGADEAFFLPAALESLEKPLPPFRGLGVRLQVEVPLEVLLQLQEGDRSKAAH